MMFVSFELGFLEQLLHGQRGGDLCVGWVFTALCAHAVLVVYYILRH